MVLEYQNSGEAAMSANGQSPLPGGLGCETGSRFEMMTTTILRNVYIV